MSRQLPGTRYQTMSCDVVICSGIVNCFLESDRLSPFWHMVTIFQLIEFIDVTVFVTRGTLCVTGPPAIRTMVTLRLVVRPVLSKPLATAGDERGQDISWSQLAQPMVGTIPTPHGAWRKSTIPVAATGPQCDKARWNGDHRRPRRRDAPRKLPMVRPRTHA